MSLLSEREILRELLATRDKTHTVKAVSAAQKRWIGSETDQKTLGALGP
jgi:hypothetical protein